MEIKNITRLSSDTVASYATAANRAGARVTVMTERVTTDYANSADPLVELHIRQHCHGCGERDGIRAPYDEGDHATRQMKRQAVAHADSCRL